MRTYYFQGYKGFVFVELNPETWECSGMSYSHTPSLLYLLRVIIRIFLDGALTP